ncbi:trypsin-like peptidase [Krasilnikovia cinnamomea]|uniref:Trypsin-like peptidase n=1 Tax=Krasilnikovia cinnamomea TaxID=349313 RepID=A0A4Q7ZI90_9ACTN|nr:serine protease [Krasilnikovia cinnamomea]RZU50548.1 trypsin-like peptidase [Krasilnikovia cinnamomea]
MRRTTSILIGVLAAVTLVLAGAALAWTRQAGTGQTVGTWHDAPAGAPTPVARQRPVAAPHGYTRVGDLVRVDRRLGYAAPAILRHPGATYVKPHFSRVDLSPGDYVVVASPDGAESYRYDTSGATWAMSITGDTAVVRLHRGGRWARPGVTVDVVARGFRAAEQRRVAQPQLTAPGTTGREESVCGSDDSTEAACYRSAQPVVYTRSRAVARLLINGTQLCTGWRVGAHNRMLTNNHCFTSSREAYRTEVWFNYECAKCAGGEALRPVKVWGDRVLATNRVYDYTLFTVDDFPRVQRFGYLTFDSARPRKGQELYVPQHPAGAPRRISGGLKERAGTCAVVDPSYDGYARNSDVAYYCDTAGGSSGSPVLSRATNRVVALHHFGGCPNSGVRADLIAARLRTLL